jgi:ketosteroid isomerase-like protein
MKRRLAIGGIVLLTAGAAFAQTPATSSGGKMGGGISQTLIHMEQQWTTASKASDIDALAPMIAGDFVQIDSDGTTHDKADVVARTKKAKWTTNEISDLKVMVHGDSAVVTGTWVGKGTDGMGRAVDARERWADTWVKSANGKWQVVASASAPIK